MPGYVGVCVAVGVSDGVEVGDAVGVSDGVEVGDAVGELDGVEVGDAVGEPDGVPVAVAEGVGVRSEQGERVIVLVSNVTAPLRA